MKLVPAIDVRAPEAELLYALLDDFAPTAIEERHDGVRAFFASPGARDTALDSIASRYDASPIDVPDDDWARRSQDNLPPVTVGRITIATPHAFGTGRSAEAGPISILIQPSMGFGTGHHATTRLCLDALQHVDVAGKTVLDVGTGSGVLAIAADRLGAARAIGIDVDGDAIEAARENLTLNRDLARDMSRVTFEIADLTSAALPPADIVTANLTGALLVRSADRLLAAVRDGGILIASGLMRPERDEVVGAFTAVNSVASARIVRERDEDEWVGLTVKKT
jgi:ribosomal protein L11 methyltransferase